MRSILKWILSIIILLLALISFKISIVAGGLFLVSSIFLTPIIMHRISKPIKILIPSILLIIAFIILKKDYTNELEEYNTLQVKKAEEEIKQRLINGK